MNHELPDLSARKTKVWWSLLLAAGLMTTANAAEPDGLPLPNWNRTAAIQAAAIPQDQQELHGWLQLIDAGNADQLLARLQHSTPIGGQTDSPAREAQLFELAVVLAEAPQDAAIDAVLLWLADYASTVLVAHEEHADYGIPLYPVAAAARGSLAERQRQQAEMLSSRLLTSSPKQWISHYLTSSPVEQQGFNSSLRIASLDSVLPLAKNLQQQLTQNAELAVPAGELASLLGDPQLFLAAYQNSQGDTSVSLLRNANWRLDAAQRSQLLADVIALDSVGKSALAISVLAPGLHRNSEVSEQLLQLLDDPDLGAAAALALVGHPDQQVQARLQDMRLAGGLKAQRAAIALDQSVFIQPGGNNHGGNQQ